MHRRVRSMPVGPGADDLGTDRLQRTTSEDGGRGGAIPATLLADTPLLRTQIKHSIDEAEAFGTRLKNVHRLSESYSQALGAAASCWSALIAELNEVAADFPLRDEADQVASSLKGLSEQVMAVLGMPMRAFYEDEIKPMRETKKEYDRLRHKYDDALKSSLSLKQQAQPAQLQHADEELSNKKRALDLQRFDLNAGMEAVQMRRALTTLHVVDFFNAHVAAFHTSFGVLSTVDTHTITEQIGRVRVSLEERLRYREMERSSLPLPSKGSSDTEAACVGEPTGASPAAVVAGLDHVRSLGATDTSLGCEKQGLLFHQSAAKSSMTKVKLKRRWCVVSDGYMFVYKWKGKDKENVAIANIKAQLNLLLCSVKPDDTRIRFCFVIINQSAEAHRFQATSEAEMRTWLVVIQNAIGAALNAQPLLSRLSRSSVASAEGDERPGNPGSPGSTARTASTNARLARKLSFENQQRAVTQLEALLADPGNSMCADCSTTTNLTWASINLGIFLCIDCAGVHRGLGTHISKVRSLELDTREWSESQISLMAAVGNEASNRLWEATLGSAGHVASTAGDEYASITRPQHGAKREEIERFIRAKYERRAFVSAAPFATDKSFGPEPEVYVDDDNQIVALPARDISPRSPSDEGHGSLADGSVRDVQEASPSAALHRAFCTALLHGSILDCISCLALGASTQQRCPEGRLPIHYAAISGNHAALELVMQNGGDINAQDEANGWTALHCVAAADSTTWKTDDRELAAGTALCLLAKSTLDQTILDVDGRTALALAEQTGNTEVVAVLNGRRRGKVKTHAQDGTMAASDAGIAATPSRSASTTLRSAMVDL